MLRERPAWNFKAKKKKKVEEKNYVEVLLSVEFLLFRGLLLSLSILNSQEIFKFLINIHKWRGLFQSLLLTSFWVCPPLTYFLLHLLENNLKKPFLFIAFWKVLQLLDWFIDNIRIWFNRLHDSIQKVQNTLLRFYLTLVIRGVYNAKV